MNKTKKESKMFDIILRNEFKEITGRDMSNFELTALKDYIEFYGDDTWNLEDAHEAVTEFVETCYDTKYDFENGTQYTIHDWMTFPFAKREYFPDRTVITYRGGTTTIYEPKAKCAWCGEEERVFGQYGRCDNGEAFCSDQCKKDYETEHGSTATDAMPFD